MRMSWIVAVGGACLLTPVMASAQQRQGAPPPSASDTARTASDSGRTGRESGRRAAARADTSSTATASASTSGASMGDPKMIGSPAWWSRHATADGKPKSEESSNRPQKRNP
jgi:hypothetical protein